MALAVEAVRPQADVKEKWLATILDASATSKVATLRTLMANLFPAEQTALLEPQRERILAAIPMLNQNASQELLESITDGLIPATCTPDSVARLAQANTDFAGMLPLVVKASLVHHQRAAACVRLKTNQ